MQKTLCLTRLLPNQVSLSQTNIYLNSESKNKLLYIKKNGKYKILKKHVAEKK